MELLKSDFEKRSQMFMVDLRRRLQDERCEDNANTRTHFDTMCTMCEDFNTMLLGLLPWSYNSYLSAVTTALSVLETKLTLDALMLSIIDKFDRHTVKTCQSRDKGKDIVFHSESRFRKPWKGGQELKKSVESFNCHRKWHVKGDC